MSHFVVMRHSLDPARHIPEYVATSEAAAQNFIREWASQKAARLNAHRRQRFEEGLSCDALMKEADISDWEELYIVEVP